MADLFIKPIKSWKRILSPRKTSIDYFIIYVLFYGTFCYIITWDFQQVITNVFITLLITFIPFLFFLIPFIIFSRLWKKSLKTNRLYRLFFIFNIQMIPLIHFPNLLAQWADVELPYLFSSNSTVIFDLLTIMVVPLVLKLKVRQKFIWILCNYIFACFYLISFNKILTVSDDLRTIVEKANYYTPKDEYMNMMGKYKKSDLYLDKNLIYVSFLEKNGRFKLVGIQYCTLFTSDYIIKKVNDRLNIIRLSDIESLHINILNSRGFSIYNEIYRQFKKDSLSIKFPFKPFSKVEINKMDSLRVSFNELFYSDLKLMDSLRNKAKYKSNREYANYVYNYLNQYNMITKNISSVKHIIKSSKVVNILEFENSYNLFTYYLDDKFIKYDLQGIINRNIRYGKMYKNTQVGSEIIFYPVFELLNYKKPIFDYTKQFENIDFRGKPN